MPRSHVPRYIRGRTALNKGVAIDRVSLLLGHSSVKVSADRFNRHDHTRKAVDIFYFGAGKIDFCISYILRDMSGMLGGKTTEGRLLLIPAQHV